MQVSDEGMTRHILQDETYLEVLPTQEVIMRQGSQCIIMSREKWLEALLFIAQAKIHELNHAIPKLPLRYQEGQE